jgi:hypothetical protein
MNILSLVKEQQEVTTITNITPYSISSAFKTGANEFRRWFLDIVEKNNKVSSQNILQTDQVDKFLREWGLAHPVNSEVDANKAFGEGVKQALQFFEDYGIVDVPEIKMILVSSEINLYATGWISDFPIYSGSLWGNMAAQVILQGRSVRATHRYEDIEIVASPAEELEDGRGTKITINSLKGSVTEEIKEVVVPPGENWLLPNAKVIYERVNSLLDDLFDVMQ